MTEHGDCNGGARITATSNRNNDIPVPRSLQLLVCCALTLSTSHRVWAQGAALSLGRSGSSREELQALVSQAEVDSATRSDRPAVRDSVRQRVQRIQRRLAEGDFHPGDHIALFVEGEQALTDTFTVRDGNALELPMVGAISLRGVLRSELQPYMSTHLALYIRNPSVRATSLIRVVVLGAVVRPGFYSVRPDISLGDLLMRAGGPASNADLAGSFVRRGGAVTWATEGIRSVLSEGMTLDDIEVQSGDEIVVAEEKHVNWPIVSQVITALVGVAVGLVALSR